MSWKQWLGLLFLIAGIALILLGEHYMNQIVEANGFIDRFSNFFTGMWGKMFGSVAHEEVNKYTPKVQACMYLGGISSFLGIMLLIFGGTRQNFKIGRGGKSE
jgi:drug/metabolite transporter (DMT)-like permease